MRKAILGSVFGVATLLAADAALAQVVTWEITPEEERTVYTTIYGTRATVGAAPAREFDITVGATIPAEVEIYEVPAAVTYAPARQYRYVLHGNRVVFVEPGSRRVVRVIGP
jgi:hypothetical protein